MKRRQTKILKKLSEPFVFVGRCFSRVFSAVHTVALLFLWWCALALRRLKSVYASLEKQFPLLRHLWMRIVLVVLAVFIFLSPIYSLTLFYVQNKNYTLTREESALVGRSTANTAYIKETADAITYNRSDEQTPKGTAQALTVAANKSDASGEQPYQAELSKDPRKGITFGDSDDERKMTLVPTFSSQGARLSEGRVLYPKGADEQHIYTFKSNGIKSDILLSKAPGDGTVTYSWQLKLEDTLEARMDGNGGIGIYSADALFFDNIQVGDQKTQELVDKARSNSTKNNLVFELPKPFIIDADGQTRYDDVSYSLQEGVLTLTARNLQSYAYPLTIDPTITVTTTADFAQNGGDMGNIDPSTANEIRRSDTASGAVGTATQQAGIMQTARSNHTSIVYNGYLYTVGGLNSTRRNTIESCVLNSGGSLGTCNSVGTFTTGRDNHASVVYNGYLYIVGGYDGTNNLNDIQRCQLGASGTVGTCTQQTNAFTNVRRGLSTVAYDDYLYIIGGWNGTTNYNDIQSCAIRADGSVGTCNSVGTFTTGRSNHSSVVYNGYLYIIGGADASTYNDIQYCPINSSGTVGTCTQQTNAFTTQRYDHSSVVYNGYLYIIGGYFSGTRYDDIQYCPINTTGSVGACTQKTAAFTTARSTQASVAYNGYIYVIGGADASVALGDVQRLQVAPIVPQAISGATTLTATYRHGIAAYDGYMYVVAGSTGLSELDTVEKCVIENDASLGSCDAAGTLVRPTSGGSVTMYHNIIYMSGGYILEDDNVVPDITRCVISQTTHNLTCTRQIKIINSGNTDPWLLGSAAYNGYLYLVGGHTDATNGYLNTIYRCAISESDGSVGNCTSAGSTLTVARDRLSVVIYKGYLYAIGGNTSSGYRNDIEACQINANGSVGTCSVKTTFTNARGEHTSVVYGDKLYIMGGWNGSSYYNDIIYCTLGSGGAVSGCTQQTNAFTTARYGHASAFYNGYIYILGGKSSSGYLSNVQYMQVGPSHGGVGSGGSNTFSTARDAHAAVAYDGYLYIIGGWNDPTVYGTIQYCALTANGGISTCNATTSLGTARYNHTAVAHDGYIYVINGLNSAGTNLNSVERCAINGSHAIASCTAQTNLFATARNNHASVSYNGRLYVIGGILNSVYQNDIEYCSYNADGSLGNCDQQLNIFPSARNNLAAEVYNGYLYIIGGYDGTNYRNDIIHCSISTANGSVSGCSSGQQIDGLPMNRRSMDTAVYNGYLYVFGGYKNTSTTDYYNDMQVCPLLLDGTVGPCIVKASAMSAARSSHTASYYNGYVYLAGGSNSVSHLNTIESFALDKAMPMVARYERFIDTGDGGNRLNSFTINGTTSCNYTVSYRTAGSDAIFGSLTTLSNVAAGVAQTLNITSKRYILITVTMDDMTCGNQAAITSIVIDYIYPLPPNAPTLRSPTNAATSVNVQPDLQLGVTGDASGVLEYSIDVCSTSNCSSIVRTIDQTVSGTGWSNVGVVVDTYVVSHKYQLAALSPATQYWWRAKAIDRTDANLWSNYSSIFSFTTSAVTAAPTLYLPANAGTDINVRPEFRVGVAGNNTGNLKYKIDVCSTSNCSSIVRTIDETASETGWTALGDVGGTYQMSHTYLPAALSSSTQYWWRAQAIEPNGANAWSAYSSIYSFTTGVVNAPGQIIIHQNTNIRSGSTFKTGN